MKRKLKKVLSILLLLIIISNAGCVLFYKIVAPKDSKAIGKDGLQIAVLDVGQGLCVFVESQGKTLLYDGGNRDASSYVVRWLEKYGVSEIDVMVTSHYHVDHISGLIGVMNVFPVRKIFAPAYEEDTIIYQSFLSCVYSHDIPFENPYPGKTLSLGSATIKIIGPLGSAYEDENDYSIVIKIIHGNNTIYIGGDSSTVAENELIAAQVDIASDVYIVSHHGSKSSSGKEFIEKMAPSIAVISCGAYNEFGHPTEKTVNVLKNVNTKIYRTDLQGTIVLYSDGRYLSVGTKKNNMF